MKKSPILLDFKHKGVQTYDAEPCSDLYISAIRGKKEILNPCLFLFYFLTLRWVWDFYDAETNTEMSWQYIRRAGWQLLDALC